jgi:hypothetical protein
MAKLKLFFVVFRKKLLANFIHNIVNIVGKHENTRKHVNKIVINLFVDNSVDNVNK